MFISLRVMMLPLATLALAVIPLSQMPVAHAQQGGNPLIGQWAGYRPTNGYIWEFRYQMEFLPDGTYSYLARQVSPKKPFFKIQLRGRYRFLDSDSRNWQALLELIPDAGSAGPPTEDDRSALVDLLGLPDNNARKFRIRRESFRVGFDLQLTDANPSDGIDQVWYLAKPE